MEEMIGLGLKVLAIGAVIIACLFILLMVLGLLSIWSGKALAKSKKKKVKASDKKLRKYLMDFKENKLEVIDETPRDIFIGDRFYILKPLKYRQFTRICILMGKTLEKLQGMQINLEQADLYISKILENSEDELFKGLAYVLYFSNNEFEENDVTIIEGVEQEFLHLKNNASLEEMVRLLEVIAVQNDIDRALKAFGVFAPKKKIPLPSS